MHTSYHVRTVALISFWAVHQESARACKTLGVMFISFWAVHQESARTCKTLGVMFMIVHCGCNRTSCLGLCRASQDY
jgi:hypothetical protein